jgi:hypothetical protein
VLLISKLLSEDLKPEIGCSAENLNKRGKFFAKFFLI